MANLDIIILHAPHGLNSLLDHFDGPSREGRISEILDTLQVLADQLDDHYIEASRLRGLVFALQEGDQAQPALQKIAAELSAIPEPIFRAAADHVIQSRPLRFARSEKVVADLLKALHARSGPPISQQGVPMILRLTEKTLLENENGRRATHALKRIEQSLREAYDQMKTPEEKLSVLQQYSYFVILTSGLIPVTATVDLALLPKVIFGQLPAVAEASSNRDTILLSEKDMAGFSPEHLFRLMRHEAFHVLQKLEGLRDPEVDEEFVDFAGKNLFQLVQSQRLQYAAQSALARRSRWLQNLFEAYNGPFSAWVNASALLSFELDRLFEKSEEFEKVWNQIRSEEKTNGEPTKTFLSGLEKEKKGWPQVIGAIQRDPKLGESKAKKLQVLVADYLQKAQAYGHYPIEVMADTPFTYGRAGEVIDPFFGREK